MIKRHEEYNELLTEQLELAGILLDEADEKIDIPDDEPDDELDAEIESDEYEEDEEDKKDKENKGEIKDQWESKINSKGDFKIELYDNFIYAYYKNRRSQKISIDPKIKPYKKIVSEFINKILGHIEKTS